MKANQPSVPKRRRRGSTLVEFTLLGIPAIFLCVSVVSVSIDMWQFFTLSYAVEQTARYTALHGSTCSLSPNSCTITRANVATYFEGQAIALAAASTTMILNDGSGAITCNPVSSCPSSSSTFPSSGNNTPGTNNVTVTASYALINPIVMLWPGAAGGSGVKGSSFTVKATSTQEVLF
jgi:Flp pilus assembly protein TadG